MRNPVIPILLALTASSCTEPVEEEPDTVWVTGTISYRERMALSPEAVAAISVEDVSIQDVAAKVIASQRITNPGQVPIRFELEIPVNEIDERMSYSVRARINDRGRLMFINDINTPVLTRGAPRHVDMTLIRVKSSEETAKPSSGVSHGMELEGMFRYMADAALFRDCRTNKTFPVSIEGAYIELERAYLNSGIEPGSEIMVSLVGRMLERPSMEGNINKVKLIIDKVIKLHPEKICAATVHADLLNSYWKLVEIGGEPVVTPEGMKEAHLILSSAESRAHGNAGCNNFFGQFEADEESLKFSAMGSTMMACPQAMDTESAFLQALSATTKFQIRGLFLELYEKNTLLARLEVIYH